MLARMVPPTFQRPNPHFWSGAPSRSPVVDLKIKWANHHRERLHRAIEDFRERKPYLIDEDRRSYEDTDYRVLSARPEPAPDEIGLILGDYVQNLRSSLDYLIGAMRPDGPSRNSQFPVLLRRPKGPHGFRKRCCVLLHHVPDEAVRLIHWMQPYHRSEWGARVWDALAALDVLWNVSKHRTLLIATAITRPDYVARERSGEEAKRIGFRFTAPNHSSEIWLPISEPEEHFEPHFSVHVTLAEPRGFARDWPWWINEWEVDELVNYLYRAVAEQVVPRFNDFVQPIPEPDSHSAVPILN